MSEYELADLVRSISADSLVFLPMLLSVVSGYLVVAWVVGARLTLAQVSLVNTLFVSVVMMFCFGWVNRVQLALVLLLCRCWSSCCVAAGPSVVSLPVLLCLVL